jgi:hypothetical protein
MRKLSRHEFLISRQNSKINANKSAPSNLFLEPDSSNCSLIPARWDDLEFFLTQRRLFENAYLFLGKATGFALVAICSTAAETAK